MRNWQISAPQFAALYSSHQVELLPYPFDIVLPYEYVELNDKFFEEVRVAFNRPQFDHLRSAVKVLAEPEIYVQVSGINAQGEKIRVIAAHSGGYIHWRPWAALAAYQTPLYGDLAVWDTLACRNYPLFCRQLREVIDLAGEEKILFGTDGPVQSLLYPIKTMIGFVRDLPEKAPPDIRFTREEVDRILGANAATVFGLGSKDEPS